MCAGAMACVGGCGKDKKKNDTSRYSDLASATARDSAAKCLSNWSISPYAWRPSKMAKAASREEMKPLAMRIPQSAEIETCSDSRVSLLRVFSLP